MGTTPLVAKAMLHRWEEPCISGKRGSGTVFFTGCALGCIYCQNRKISMEKHGKPVAPGRLREIYFELIEQGAHHISLVTPSHFADGILSSLEGRLPVPVV
jgi:putative pyruvate formate lyase activating enzyme